MKHGINSMTKARLLLCSMAMLCLCAPRSWAGKITEPDTGVSFSRTRKWGAHQQIAVGLAAKKKLFFKVYAACLYIEQKAGRRSLLKLARTKGLHANGAVNTGKLPKKAFFYRWLVNSDLALTIDLTFVRGFGYSNFKKKYRQKLGLYLQDKQLIERFLALPSGDIKRFGHLTFNLMPGGQVILQYMGQTFAPIVSRSLKRAVLSTFLDRRSGDDRIRTGLVRDIHRLLD